MSYLPDTGTMKTLLSAWVQPSGQYVENDSDSDGDAAIIAGTCSRATIALA